MRITLLGSGNVATHLGKAFKQAGHEIVEIWSRTPANAKTLAIELSTRYCGEMSLLSPNAEIYIISVSDDSIREVSAKFPFRDKILIHTAGTSELNIPGLSGVFYPVQTFSKQSPVDFSNIPIAVEGINPEVSGKLLELAGTISTKVSEISSQQRKTLHLAAVFACNFSNHLYAIADKILQSDGLEFEMIRPLIMETAKKIQTHSARSVQTGPAIRNDQITLRKHLEFLENNPALRDLYERLSQSIINFD
ncbi:Rossmann-like and DUF2520 domain-containing protein [Paradesertivirga mongoliensis]|uniref:Rossmann-like and DUF2520 domain-containing protein n=1 Tax=Paradesertivirga mongoliensis TaxID=2100740 RepID=A0ABW4ZQR0_9SPHI|nr:DUF2520 domain-containing protein [Pedobacter mongoliensis]